MLFIPPLSPLPSLPLHPHPHPKMRLLILSLLLLFTTLSFAQLDAAARYGGTRGKLVREKAAPLGKILQQKMMENVRVHLVCVGELG
jgi:hypothetical protein